jgi:hypothetical protein
VDDATFDLELLASSLQADSADVRLLLKVLVDNLSAALGSRLTVERGGGRLFKKPTAIQRVVITVGDDQLEAVVDGDRLACTVARSSGGIRIRSTKVSMDEWLQRLLSALRDEAATSESTRRALESMVLGGGQ